MRIGIDIGNVIIGGGGDDTQFFGDNYLVTPEVPHAYTSIYPLGSAHEVHLVSKCGPKTEQRTMEWLKYWAFIPSYTLPTQRIHFVRKRSLKVLMAQALELDIFIDDREDIIESMIGIVEYPILFKSWEQTNIELERIMPSASTK